MDNPKMLGEKSINRLLWDFSLPAITGMLVNALYNVVDSIFVGHGVGAIGLAAVTIAFPIMIVFMGFGMLVGVGATTLISIRIGQQKKQEAEKILGNALVLGMILSISLSTLFLIFLDPLLVRLGAEPMVLPYAHDFTHIILLGSIFMFTGFGLNNIIRAEGSPKVAMMTMIISAVLNTILNPLFIFGLGMGIRGSALATVLSQAVSAIWVLSHFLGSNSFLKFRPGNFVLDRVIVTNIFTMGASAFFMQIAASVVVGLSNFTLAFYGGQMAVAAMGVINRLSMLMLMPLFGIGQGMAPIVGYNYGAKNYGRVREAAQTAIIAATVISVCGFIAIEVFDTYIIRLFSSDTELITLGAAGLRVFLCMLPIIGFQIIGSMFFQAIGKPAQSLLLSMSRQLLFLIPMLLVLPRYLGLEGVWLSGPISDLGATLVTALLFFIEIRRLTPCEANPRCD
ncbi:MAG: MATE family efflux transporter [Negativicutes bacterium]|nr:MATE family efflux transporter [Negativicutes bacterium]